MRLLIIDENGVREFTPINETEEESLNTTSTKKLLKEYFQSENNTTKKTDLNVFTITKLVELFETTRPTIYAWIDNGDLIPIKIGGRVYFNRKDIELMLDRKTKESKLS